MPGIVVIDITPTGQAANLGIRLHDVLYKYNGTLLNSTENLLAAARVGKPSSELQLIRGRELLKIIVAPGALGVSLLPYPVADLHLDGVGEVLARFRVEDAAETQIQQAELQQRIAGIPATTTPQLDGYRVIETLDIISAEYVGGVNIFRDIMGGVTDLFGGRSSTLQTELHNARIACLTHLKTEAYRLGANAVIGVDLDYSELSGGGKSMLFLVASGTAVIVEKI